MNTLSLQTAADRQPATLRPRSHRTAAPGALRAQSILLCALLAITIEFVSANLHGRFAHRDESIQHQFAILAGAPHVFEGTKYDEPVFQARIMFPLLLAGASKIGILSTGQWYLVLRILSAFAMLVVLYQVLLSGSADESAATSTLAYFSLAMIATFGFGWELSMDFFDAVFFAILIGCAAKASFRLFAITALLACFNRESAVFAGVLWALCYGVRKRKIVAREVARGLLLSAFCYSLILWIRSWFIGLRAFRAHQSFAFLNVPERIHAAITHFNPFVWPVMGLCMAGPLVIRIFERRALLSPFQRQLLFACAVIGGITLVFGEINELRVFVPSLTILAYVSACAGCSPAAYSAPAGSRAASPLIDPCFKQELK